MPTGFEKFSDKILNEDPIRIDRKRKTESPERREVKHSRHEGESRRRKEADLQDLKVLTIQLPAETKSLLDEMKFRSKRLLWDLCDEAIKDLYNKLYR